MDRISFGKGGYMAEETEVSIAKAVASIEDAFAHNLPRLPDGSCGVVPQSHYEAHDIEVSFARRGKGIEFDAHGWTVVDDYPPHWYPF